VAYNSPAINEYRSLRRGDIVFYYVTQDEPNPFTKRGFFGVGRVIKKYEAYDQFWPDEVNQGKVIYPYRFDLETLKIVAYDDDVLPWIDGLPFTEGLNHITNQEKLDQLLHNLKAKWGIEFKTIKQESAQEDYDDQLARQEQIIEKNPKDENAWYQKARILSILNREEEALHALIVVTSIWPESKSKIRHDDAFDNIRHSEMFNILTQN
jgi:tetratricopeptide (TPR) repeat protein